MLEHFEFFFYSVKSHTLTHRNRGISAEEAVAVVVASAVEILVRRGGGAVCQ